MTSTEGVSLRTKNLDDQMNDGRAIEDVVNLKKSYRPNKLTAETIKKSERGEDLHHAQDIKDLFRQLNQD